MNPEPLEVVFVGRANIDLKLAVPHLPEVGLTAIGSKLTISPGGKSLNQAVAAARLGGRVGLIANAGDDQWSQRLRQALTEAGVETSGFVSLPSCPTGVAVVMVTPDGESYVTLVPPPEVELTHEQVRSRTVATPAPALVVQLDQEAAVIAAALASDRRLKIGNLVPRDDAGRHLLARLDLLVVNLHEAAMILEASVSDALAAATRLRSYGPGGVVVTAGAQGAVYSTPTTHGHVAAESVTPVDATGAGDAFLGALALELARGGSLAGAVRKGVGVGTRVVQHRGSQLLT